jgi:hypothetical protein
MSYTNGLDKPTDYFNTKLYTGNGNSSHAITGVGFQPDWVWIKDRDSAVNHLLHDSIRGVTNLLVSNTNAGDDVNTIILKSFDTDGFTVGSNGASNENGTSFVSWNWLGANGTASNTDGSITSTVSANTTSGFSIVSYTGTGANATIGHGLGVAPNVVWVKNRSQADVWTCYYSVLGSGKYIELSETSSEQTAGVEGRWNNTNPNSTVVSLGIKDQVNGSSENIIAYCFAEKKAFSKFGSYTGNGSTDGTFVYTGFKPAYLIVKRTDSTSNWNIFDNKRNPYNNPGILIAGNNANPDASSYPIDFISNGFKCRSTLSDFNASGGSFIYMCFSENPFVTSTGIPTVAR